MQQSARQQYQQNQRGGRPQYRYQRWTPPPEPKPEPKLDLSDKTFPSLPMSNVVQQSPGQHEFGSKFSTTVKVMAELEKLQELREEREKKTTQQEKASLRGVYTGRFQHGRLSQVEAPREPREPREEWRAPPQEPAEDEWVEVRHSKARKVAHEKTAEELDDEYEDKAADEEAAEDYNGDLFERSHRHDHYAT